MALEYRWPHDFSFGTLTAQAAASDTSLSSAEFAELGVVGAGAMYIPIVLLNPITRTRENVWVTVHTAAATSATVLRGKESTTAQDWPTGTQWISAVTLRDVTGIAASAVMPADPHVGLRVTLNDTGEVLERTYAQGWVGHARMSRADVGRSLDGVVTAPPNGMVPLLRALTYAGTTNATGQVLVPLPNGGFPNRLITATATRVAGGTWYTPQLDNAFSTKSTVGVLCTTSAGAAVASTSVTVAVIAVGY